MKRDKGTNRIVIKESLFRKWCEEERKVEIAKYFGISKQALFDWFKYGVPNKRLFAVSELTGIPVESLIKERAMRYKDEAK